MEINILHLYKDLLNLYGDHGNVKILKKHLEDQEYNVNVDELCINDDLDFSKYDFVYIGGGTERNQLVALEYLKKYKESLENAIENNKVILVTGNAIELFGQDITDIDNNSKEALGIFPYNTKRIEKRVSTDIICQSELINEKVIGYMNKEANIYGIDKPLFNIIFGKGANEKELIEGYKYNNFYATYLIGPILSKNPEFIEHIMEKVIENKENRNETKKIQYINEEKAYENTLNAISKRMNDK